MPCDFTDFHNASNQAEAKVNKNDKFHYWSPHFLHQSAEHAYPVSAASVWFEAALNVIPFYSLK